MQENTLQPHQIIIYTFDEYLNKVLLKESSVRNEMYLSFRLSPIFFLTVTLHICTKQTRRKKSLNILLLLCIRGFC